MSMKFHLNYVNSLILHLAHLEIGLKMVRLDTLDLIKVEEEYTILKTSTTFMEFQNLIRQQIKIKLSVMLELVPITKKKILIDKSHSLQKSIHKQKSSKILDLDSIGRDQDLSPFWNKYTKEMSNMLWSPIKTDSVDLDLNYWSGSSRRLMLNSWFSARIVIKKTFLESYQTTYLQSLQSLLPEIMVCEQDTIEEKGREKKLKILNLEIERKRLNQEKIENETPSETEIRLSNDNKREKLTKLKESNKLKRKEKCEKDGIEFVDPTLKDAAGKSKHYRIYPTKEQKIKLRKWFGVRRWIYNKCLESYKNGVTTLKGLRESVIKNQNYMDKNQWMLKYDFDLRDEALQDLLKNIKSNKAKNKNFQMKFKSKKDMMQYSESISVLSKKWNQIRKSGFYHDIFSSTKMKSAEKLPVKLDYTSRLIRCPLNKYYFSIPNKLDVVSDNQATTNSMLFIDPGVKTFLTGYDPSGKVIHIGEGDVGRISRLLYYRDKLNSKMRREKVKKKKRLQYLAMLRIYEKIKNLVNDLHKKSAKWLCENYTNVYIPRLNFHDCKKLNRKSKAKMSAYRHCEFLNLLQDKTREYTSCKVLEVNESYTSKTCSRCGNQKNNLRNKDVYNCDNGGCGLEMGRDTNASKNIMLRYFTKRAILH